MSRGFSLVELIIVIGIGSVAAAGIYSIMSQLMDQQAALDGKMDLKVMANEIRPRLENAATCVATFDTNFRYNPTEAARVSPLGQSIVGGLALPNGQRIMPGAAMDRYALQVIDVKLTNAQTTAPNTYIVQVEGHMRASRGKQLPYAPELFTTLTLVTGPGNVIASCRSAAGGGAGGGGTPTMASSAAQCQALGGYWTAGGQEGNCLYCMNGQVPLGFAFSDYPPVGPTVNAICPNPQQNGN